MNDDLVGRYEAILFDLDGVVYLGPRAVDHAPEVIAQLRRRELRVGFVTNNAARTPRATADHLTEIGVAATVDDVITSSQAGARLLTKHLEPGAAVLIVGTAALAHEVELQGFRPVYTAAEEPAAVIQGYDPKLAWPMLDEAAVAIQHGALWVATNTDSTRPTDRGIVPGNGAGVAALQMAVRARPLVAGKPYAPLMEEALRRTDTTRALFVGDRTDTDVEGAAAVGIDSAFVMTGAHGPEDLLVAPAPGRPTWLLGDLRELHMPPRTVQVDGPLARCGDQRATIVAGRLEVTTGTTRGEMLDSLWAGAQLVWRAADAGETLDTTQALATWRLLH